MKDKYLYIVDIRFKQKQFDLSNYGIEENAKFLSLNTYSSYLLESIEKPYDTFHSLKSEDEFHTMVLKKYTNMENIFLRYKNYSFLFRDFSSVITIEIYLRILFEYLKKMKIDMYKIIYITDVDIATNENVCDNNQSYIYKSNMIDSRIKLNTKDTKFYKQNNYKMILSKIIHTKNIMYKVIKKSIYKDSIEMHYDNQHYKSVYKSLLATEVKNKVEISDVEEIYRLIQEHLMIGCKEHIIEYNYIHILKKFKYDLENFKNKLQIHPFTFLANNKNYIEVLLYKLHNIPKIFMQHGSYLQENIFLKYNEIYPSDINFVLNDFSKNLFKNRGAKKVYSVGSIDFNYEIKEKRKEYDFLYITYCTSYACSATHIFSYDNILSIDGNNIYKRHKNIVNLFGTKLKNKKICIKIQQGIFTEHMLYVPFLELSKKHKNITIEFTVPISKLIGQSKYIISDYFSSEFINRELHYKRDIILFKGAPLPLSKEILEDMKKMFILVDNVDDLETIVQNIENITKNRKRYDDIIEYYSSKKCDTKKIVTEILKKELTNNGENN